MKKSFQIFFVLIAALGMSLIFSTSATAADPLPSWSDNPTKATIIEFVQAVTREGGKDYVLPAERIATFDNDGTLWVEYPMYTQVLFAFERVKKLAPQHPEWKIKQPFKALLEGDMKTVGAFGTKGLMEIILATHTGMTATEFSEEVDKWLTTTQHPKFKRPYVECIINPRLNCLNTYGQTNLRPSLSPVVVSLSCARLRNKRMVFRRNRSSVPASLRNFRSRTASRNSSACRRLISSTTRRASR